MAPKVGWRDLAFMERNAYVSLAQLVYKITTNPEFAAAFRTQPRLQLAAVGAKLTDFELSALLRALEAKEEQGRSLMGPSEFPSWYAV